MTPREQAAEIKGRVLRAKLERLVELRAYFDTTKDIELLDQLINRMEWRKSYCEVVGEYVEE